MDFFPSKIVNSTTNIICFIYLFLCPLSLLSFFTIILAVVIVVAITFFAITIFSFLSVLFTVPVSSLWLGVAVGTGWVGVSII